MKKLVLACIVLCGFAAPGVAADFPVAPYQPPLLAPLFSWTGCRIGVNIGGGAAPQSFTDTAGVLPPYSPGASLGTHTARGVVGGGQLGCDYQAGAFVFGIQGFYDLSGMKANNLQPNGIYLNDSFVQSIATLTGRVGYTVTPTALLYAKAGGAWVHDLYNVSTPLGQAIAGTIQALGAKTTAGWTVGAGFEWALFGSDWSAFLEYDYMGFGTSQVTYYPAAILPGFPTGAFPIGIRQTVNIGLIGLNYRFFGGGPRF